MKNQVTLIGRLGAVATIRTIGSGRKVANMDLVTEENYKDREGKWQTKATWHRIAVFGDKNVDYIGRNYGKGDMILFEGTLGYNTSEKDGVKYHNVVLAGETQLLSQAEANRQARSAAKEEAPKESQAQNFDMDDEIPF